MRIRVLWCFGYILTGMTLSGCGGAACVSFIFNPGGTVHVAAGNPPPPCTFPPMKSAIRITSLRVPECAACPNAGRPRHILVALRGIEIRPDSSPNDGDWLMLEPQLQAKPLQIDLANPEAEASMTAFEQNAVLVPAGVYHQMRIRFVAGQNSKAGTPLAGECSTPDLPCMVFDEQATSHSPAGSASEAVIRAALNPSGFLVVPGGGETRIGVEFGLSWRAFSSAPGGVQLLPVLAAGASVDSRVPGTGGAQ